MSAAIPSGSGASRPSAATAPSAPASWEKKTWAGVASPSSSSWAASSALSPNRASTGMPVSSVNWANSGATSSSLRPE